MTFSIILVEVDVFMIFLKTSWSFSAEEFFVEINILKLLKVLALAWQILLESNQS